MNNITNNTLDFANQELTRHLKLLNIEYMCTAILLLAGSDFEHNDSIHISIENGSGTIQGSNPRATLIGVYTFLDSIGFRFVAPGKDGTIIPQIHNIEALTCELEHTASLKHRGVCIEGSNSAENVYDFIDWLPKVGFNSFFIQFKNSNTFLERYYHHVFNPYLSIEEADYEHINAKIDQELNTRSLYYHKVGHGWTCDVLGLDTNGWDTFEEELPEETLEKMAMLNGERKLHMGIPSNTNLCYSNKAVQTEFSDIVIAYAKANPSVDYLHVWLADEPNNICECENCQKDILADQYIRILNLIDEKLIQEKLDTKIVFLLYQELLYPPLHEAFHNNDRFLLMFAPISRTFKKSYPDKIAFADLPEYKRNHMILPTNIEENLTCLSKWQEKFIGDSFVYDYPLGRAHYGDLGYVAIAKVISQDIKNLKNLGLNGYISCQELRVSLPNALPNYVMGKTLFNSAATFTDLVDEYYVACYEDDHKTVYTYLDTLSRLCDCDFINGKYKIAPTDTIANFEKALKLVADNRQLIDDLYRKYPNNTFYKILHFHNQYSAYLLKAVVEKCHGHDADANIEFDVFHRFVCNSEVDYQPYFDVYRVSEVCGKYTDLHPLEH